MIFKPSGCAREAQNQLFLTLAPSNRLENTETIISILRNLILGNLRILNIGSLKNMERRVPTNPADPSYTFLKILNARSKSSRKHELEICLFQLKELKRLNFICIFN